MYYIGVDLGGTNIATGVLDSDGNIVAKTSAKTLGQRPPEEITASIADTIKAAIAAAEISEDEVAGIGVGIPGSFDNEKGNIILTNNMNLSHFAFVPELRKYINKPVIMGNDANCAVLGEMIAGGAQGHKDVIMITIGTGVGGGFVSNGKVYGGVNGAAMEVGHMIIYANGPACNCGRKGCWELYASATSLVKYTKEYMEEYPDSLMHKIAEENGGKVNGITSFKAAREGDEAGNKVVDKFVYYISLGIADLINIFQPGVLLIGGGVSKEGDYLIDKIKTEVRKQTYASGFLSKETEITVATLANDAGIIGAGMMVDERYR